MSYKERVIATVVIWIAFSIISSTLFTSVTGAIANADGVVVFGIFLVLAFAAMISTIAVWFGGRGSQDEIPVSKQKRLERTRVDRLISQLSDDEIYELEARLLAEREQESGRSDLRR